MDLTQLKQSLCELLQGAPGFAQVEVLRAFPAQRHLPLPGPTLILGIDGLELTGGGLDGLGSLQAGGQAAVSVRLDIFAPGDDGHGLHPLYEALCSVMMERGGAYGLARLWCEPLRWDEAAASYRLSARALLRGRASGGPPREDEARITGFKLARKEGMSDVK